LTKNSFKPNLQGIFFFLILIVLSIGFYAIIRPFLIDILMAILLAVLFKKPFNYFTRKFKGNKRKSCILVLIMVIFVIIIPLSFIGIMLSKEVSHGYDLFTNNWTDIKFYVEHIPEKLSENPVLKSAVDNLDWYKIAENTNKTLAFIAEFILGMIQKTFINIGFMIAHFFIVLFLLYYVFIDGNSLLKRLQYLVPLKDSDELKIIAKFEQVINAIIFNTLMIGIMEGIYGAILFTILGVPSPFFWGMIMTFLSIIPVVGANSVFFPMAVYQIIIGNTITGVLILVFGVGAVSINQNIVKPRLDGNKSGIHPAIMFLAGMGGLLYFGVIGFIIGPIITSVFILFLDFYGEKYKNQLIKQNEKSD